MLCSISVISAIFLFFLFAKYILCTCELNIPLVFKKSLFQNTMKVLVTTAMATKIVDGHEDLRPADIIKGDESGADDGEIFLPACLFWDGVTAIVSLLSSI